MEERSLANYEISYCGDNYIGDVHHIRIDYNEYSFGVIFGRYVNGGFFSIPDWNVGGELAAFNDVFWNAERIGKVLKNKKAAKQIALAITEHAITD